LWCVLMALRKQDITKAIALSGVSARELRGSKLILLDKDRIEFTTHSWDNSYWTVGYRYDASKIVYINNYCTIDGLIQAIRRINNGT
jgi:hypothetical protein